MLTVGDTGQGMTSEVRDRLFEPFFTTKELGRGTGLGLSMVNDIVRQSGGHIQVESTPGAGTRFHVYFPRQAPIGVVPTPAMAPRHAALVKGEGVILLAEDDPGVRRLVVAELTRRGFVVIEAEDGRAALESLEHVEDHVDVLVTDVVMPRMSGADLAGSREGSAGLGPVYLGPPGVPGRDSVRGRAESVDEAVHGRHTGLADQGSDDRRTQADGRRA
jgi:hypothetical protein